MEPKEHVIFCPDCGRQMELRKGKWGVFYGCSGFPSCKTAHGAHPNGDPKGLPADEQTRRWRTLAHRSFDRLWRNGSFSRNSAYSWLQNKMGLSSKECHIGRFNQDQCEMVVELCDDYWKKRDYKFKSGANTLDRRRPKNLRASRFFAKSGHTQLG